MALQVVEMAGNVFQYADLDATLCHFAREGQSISVASYHISYVSFWP